MRESANNSPFSVKLRLADIDLEIHQAHCRDFNFPMHVHEEYTVGIIHSGEEIITHKGTRYHAGTNQLYFINPDEAHTGASVDRGSWLYTSIYFKPDFLNNKILFDKAGTNYPYFQSPILENPKLSTLFINTIQQIKLHNCPMERDDAVHGLLCSLFAANTENTGRDIFSTAHPAKNKSKINKAKQFLSERLSEPISLSDLAAHIDWHPGYVVEAFKKTEGLTPHRYLLARRIIAAKNAIISGADFNEIALDCGFYDQSHMNRHFRQVLGITPGQLRVSYDSARQTDIQFNVT